MQSRLCCCVLSACVAFAPHCAAAARGAPEGEAVHALLHSHAQATALRTANAAGAASRASAPVRVEYVRAPVRGYVLRPSDRAQLLRAELSGVPNASESQTVRETAAAPEHFTAPGLRDFVPQQRLPRRRSSPLDAMVTLRVGGEGDSPAALSLGGGVAGMLWRAMPRN